MLRLLVGLSRIVRLNLTHIRPVLLPVAACIAVLLKYFVTYPDFRVSMLQTHADACS